MTGKLHWINARACAPL